MSGHYFFKRWDIKGGIEFRKEGIAAVNYWLIFTTRDKDCHKWENQDYSKKKIHNDSFIIWLIIKYLAYIRIYYAI